MKSERRKGGAEERRILTAMVTDPKVLRNIAGHWTREGLFASPFANIVGKWCVGHYARFGKEPGSSVLARYESWAESGKARDEATVELVGRFLQSLDEEYDPKNRQSPDAIIEIAEEHFRKVQQRRIAAEAEDLAAAGKTDAADALLTSYKPVCLNGSSVISFAEVEMRETSWLWESWFPKGELCIIDGDPGMGKSTLLLDIAARVSNGWAMPPRHPMKDKNRKPGRVLILAAEDDRETTLAPRLAASGADMRRIFAPKDDDLKVPAGLPKIESMIRDHRIKFVIFDPIMSFFDEQTDVNKEVPVRKALRAMQGVATRTGACFVMLRHLNKQSGGKSIYRGGGSIALTAVCRAQFVVGVDGDDPDGFLFAPSKLNIVKKPSPLAYRIVKEMVPHKGEEIQTSKIEWGTRRKGMSADKVVGNVRPKEDKVQKAAEMIRKALRNGPKDAAKLSKQIRFDLALSVAAWRRAKKRAKVRTEKVGETSWKLHLK